MFKNVRNRIYKNLFTSAVSIIPVVLIIIILALTGLAPLGGWDYLLLCIGTVILILGMAFFAMGSEQGLNKVGEYMGSSLSKQRHLWVIIVFAFLLGALITMAEPSLLVVASDVSIPTWLLIGVIAAGVGIFVVIGIIRILYHKSLKVWLLLFYAIVFMLIALIDDGSFLPFIFDAGGLTTGSATVPFILSLGMGIALVRGGRSNKNDTFGLVGIASIGPILTMVIVILCSKSGFTDYVYEQTELMTSGSQVMNSFGSAFIFSSSTAMGSLIEVAMAVLPIMIIFAIYELIFIKLPGKELLRLLVGFIYVYIGLTLFLTGVEAAMAPIGGYIGEQMGHYILGSMDSETLRVLLVVLITLVIGMVTILCEPAVQVLTKQIADISDGRIKRSTVLITLVIGVGVAVALSAIRAIYNFSILWYLVPGYMIALVMMFFCDDTYTAIAFDSGGTASGPMSVSFILPMIIGLTATYNEGGNIYYSGFGVIGMIALTPIIGIQILGVYQKAHTHHEIAIKRKIIYDIDDAQIIHFKD